MVSDKLEMKQRSICLLIPMFDNNHVETPIYETSESDDKDNHYATTGLMSQEKEKEPLKTNH